MAEFRADAEELTLTLDLTDEPAEVDLTKDDLGNKCLHEATKGMLRCFRREETPEGRKWDGLAESTVRRRGSGDHIGRVSGKLLDHVAGGDFEVTARSAVWRFPADQSRNSIFWRGYSLHNGNPRNRQPPRPWLGWGVEARAAVGDLLKGARPAP